MKKAREITGRRLKKLDMLLVTGEQVSGCVDGRWPSISGMQAVSLNAAQVAMRTTSAYSRAKLKKESIRERITNELDARKIVVIHRISGINK